MLQPNYGSGPYKRNHGTAYQHGDQGGGEWTNIIPTMRGQDSSSSKMRTLSQAPFKNSFSYTNHFVFYGLAPSTEYEVIVQSRNREGWSDPNEIYRFTTRSRSKLVLLSTGCRPHLLVCFSFFSTSTRFAIGSFHFSRLQPHGVGLPRPAGLRLFCHQLIPLGRAHSPPPGCSRGSAILRKSEKIEEKRAFRSLWKHLVNSSLKPMGKEEQQKCLSGSTFLTN